MEDSKVYGLLALTAIISILASIGAFTYLKDSFVGPQGEQGLQGTQGIQGEVGSVGEQGDIGATGETGATGKAFAYTGEWTKTHGWYWADDVLDDWKYTLTTDADFTMIQLWFQYEGNNPEYAFMMCEVYEGLYTSGEPITWWWGSWDWGADTLMIVGSGTYTIEVSTNYNTDIWINILEYLPSGGKDNA